MDPRVDRWLFAFAIGAWCVAIAWQLAIPMTLQHDEAAYVVGARRWLDGAPNVWLYRSLGTELLVLPGVAANASPSWMRVLPALSTLVVPFGAWALARAAFPDRAVGGWAAALLVTSHPIAIRVAEILGDLPAAGLLLVGLAILLREIERPSWKLALAAAALGAGFYVRYGSTPALVAIGVATPLFFWRWRSLAILAAALGVFAIPFVWFSHEQTGATLGVLEVASRSTKLDYVGQGLVTYVTSNPLAYFGVLVAPAMLLGVVGTFALRDRRALYLGAIAIGALVLLGLRSHAQPRYAFFVVCVLVVVGVAQLARILASRPRAQRIAALAIALAGGVTVVWAAVTRPSRSVHPAQIAQLAEAIRHDAAGQPCRIVAPRISQLVYYSGCKDAKWPDAATAGPIYFVSLGDLTVEAPPEAVPVEGVSGVVRIAD